MKVLTVVGARPQFVKAATISRVIRDLDGISESIIHTGQHFDESMSEVFFTEMSIPKPDFNLGVASLSHGAMTGRMLEGIEEILLNTNPDVMLVYGDTNSTLAGALSASKLHIPVAHVEAGLRSFNFRMPEEQNRILTDRLSEYLFCPTQTALDNSDKEGFASMSKKVSLVGDVMYDAALYYSDRAVAPASKNLPTDGFCLATVHRAEATSSFERCKGIVDAINAIHAETPVVLPLHPGARKAIDGFGLSLNAIVIEPVSYFEMIHLLKTCSFVLSDSGGVQKEAYFFGKRCLVTRDETEWTELIDNNHNLLVGTDCEKILEAYKSLKSTGFKVTASPALYGQGNAADLIVSELLAR